MLDSAKIKTGLFFGSFNPVHIGHMALANYILEYSDLSEIWFIVTPSNPLKESQDLADENLRLEMVKIAIVDEPRFSVNDIEFSMPRPSYTIDTLFALKEKHPDRQFSIIIGSDNLVHLEKWKNPEVIITTFNVIVYPRPGFDAGTAKYFRDNVSLIDAPLLDISSTLIRDAVAEKKSMRFLVPCGVYEFILNHNLYRG
ncbi:nicotinate-nucleotide adenylyltransferase [Alkalitalea saponilacus]|uniref:Probable nicotinate-nucleotide adenylyltransferase n=1 Tax=Alkalitalea saponilacus TaxID=889453 RepID=A0A1T5HSK5_9BACT|nr:nicotinate-nucleotide adenylyltransferase [Alkalitalea saponilacus]ASB47745.1 nicotinic acid mononucleotide adenylyltransferase [Alkalitalea saponilacus]SKC23676.1 nicotinate-nucleotide adenylyltransferase [Alkalitalea saponilacus]